MEVNIITLLVFPQIAFLKKLIAMTKFNERMKLKNPLKSIKMHYFAKIKILLETTLADS